MRVPLAEYAAAAPSFSDSAFYPSTVTAGPIAGLNRMKAKAARELHGSAKWNRDRHGFSGLTIAKADMPAFTCAQTARGVS